MAGKPIPLPNTTSSLPLLSCASATLLLIFLTICMALSVLPFPAHRAFSHLCRIPKQCAIRIQKRPSAAAQQPPFWTERNKKTPAEGIDPGTPYQKDLRLSEGGFSV